MVRTFKTKDIRRNVTLDRAEGRGDQGKFAAGTGPSRSMEYEVTAPGSPEAAQWEGWGTAVAPAAEEWILCQKPISERTIALNVLKWGVGGLNIDASRIPVADTQLAEKYASVQETGPRMNVIYGKDARDRRGAAPYDAGRYPKNVVFSHSLYCTEEGCVPGCAVLTLDQQSGKLSPGHYPKPGSGGYSEKCVE